MQKLLRRYVEIELKCVCFLASSAGTEVGKHEASV